MLLIAFPGLGDLISISTYKWIGWIICLLFLLILILELAVLIIDNSEPTKLVFNMPQKKVKKEKEEFDALKTEKIVISSKMPIE